MGLIFWSSSLPGDALPGIGIPHLDKAVHFGEYMVLGALCMRAGRLSPAACRPLAWAAVSFTVAAACACVDEWHQRFIPGRFPEAADLLADIAGIVAGVVLYAVIHERRSVWRP